MRASAQVAALTALFGLRGNPDLADFKALSQAPLGLRSAGEAFRDAPLGRAAGCLSVGHRAIASGPAFGAGTPRFFRIYQFS
jgi:hypothetical protein